MATRTRELDSMLQMRLSPEMHAELRAIAEQQGCSASAVAREAIATLLEKAESPLVIRPGAFDQSVPVHEGNDAIA